jgi:dihydrofolate reductase
MTPRRKLILYIAASLDGYIAQPGDDLSFLSIVEKEGEDYGYQDFIDTVDTVVLGRKTYDWVTARVATPYSGKEVFVITRTARPATGGVNFYTGDLKDLIISLKKNSGKNIFCDGGAEIVTALLQEDLIDELIISIIPVLLGSGTKLFQDNRPELGLELVSSKSWDTGLVQMHYRRISKTNS